MVYSCGGRFSVVSNMLCFQNRMVWWEVVSYRCVGGRWFTVSLYMSWYIRVLVIVHQCYAHHALVGTVFRRHVSVLLHWCVVVSISFLFLASVLVCGSLSCIVWNVSFQFYSEGSCSFQTVPLFPNFILFFFGFCSVSLDRITHYILVSPARLPFRYGTISPKI